MSEKTSSPRSPLAVSRDATLLEGKERCQRSVNPEKQSQQDKVSLDQAAKGNASVASAADDDGWPDEPVPSWQECLNQWPLMGWLGDITLKDRTSKSINAWADETANVIRLLGLLPNKESQVRVHKEFRNNVALLREDLERRLLEPAALGSEIDELQAALTIVRQLSGQLPLPQESLAAAAKRELKGRPKQPRGRKRDPAQVEADKRIVEAWAAGGYSYYVDCARALRVTAKEVKRAIDRDRHRQKKKDRSSID